jgi:hypothetical protein
VIRRACLALAIVLAAVAIAPLCGCQSAREKTLSATLATLNGAAKAYELYGLQHQETLVDQATSKEDATAKVASFRAHLEPVTKAFSLAYAGLALASLTPTTANLAAAADLLGKVFTAIKELQEVATPPPDPAAEGGTP